MDEMVRRAALDPDSPFSHFPAGRIPQLGQAFGIIRAEVGQLGWRSQVHVAGVQREVFGRISGPGPLLEGL
jgi:hypothetical protein